MRAVKPSVASLTNHAQRVICLRHLRGGAETWNYGHQRKIDNRDLRTATDDTVQINDVGRAHPDATVTDRPANVAFFGCAMDVNVARERIRVLRLAAAEPGRFVIVQGDRPEEAIAADIRRQVDALLGAPA